MLRFVQGIHKAIRSNQAYAPCQKAAHDQDELDSRGGESASQQRRTFSDLKSIPLSQPLHSSTFETGGSGRTHDTGSSSRKHRESPFPGSVSSHGLVSGAILGAGCAVFKSVHGYCSGRGSKDKTKYCPVGRYEQVLKSNVIYNALSSVAPGVVPRQDYGVGGRLSVLPKPTARQSIVHEASSDADTVDEKALRQKEFEEAQDEVNSIADKLQNVDKDNLAADHFLAVRAWQSKDFVAAAGLWQRTVDKFATPIAANRLGIIYEHGQGVPQDYQQASAYYSQAISHQCRQAMYRQAMLQMNGLVEGDTDSMELMKQSADLNYCKAQTYMGTVHFHKGNKKRAVEYFQKAASQDDVEACHYLGICYELGAGVSAADDSKAAQFYTQAAEGGNPDSQFNLATFYEEGFGGIVADEERCLYWLEKSAKQGNLKAKQRLRELRHCTMTPSVSLPAITRHLPNTLSDLAVHEMTRGYSDTTLASTQNVRTASMDNTDSLLSSASSSSSVAGSPRFYIPSGEDSIDDSSFGDWSDEGLSSASSSSLRIDDKFSIDFVMEKTSFEPSMHPSQQGWDESWRSLSGSSLYRPDAEEPHITFA